MSNVRRREERTLFRMFTTRDSRKHVRGKARAGLLPWRVKSVALIRRGKWCLPKKRAVPQRAITCINRRESHVVVSLARAGKQNAFLQNKTPSERRERRAQANVRRLSNERRGGMRLSLINQDRYLARVYRTRANGVDRFSHLLHKSDESQRVLSLALACNYRQMSISVL